MTTFLKQPDLEVTLPEFLNKDLDSLRLTLPVVRIVRQRVDQSPYFGIGVAEPRAPLLRSGLMAAALCVATISRRRYSGLNALAAAAIVLLAIDPLQLFSPGFQLMRCRRKCR